MTAPARRDRPSEAVRVPYGDRQSLPTPQAGSWWSRQPLAIKERLEAAFKRARGSVSSDRELAELAGIKEHTIRGVRQGDRLMSEETAEALARALKTTLPALLSGEWRN